MLIPRKILFGNPEKASPQVSPDGLKLAYLAPEEGVLNIWVRTIGASDDHAITHDRHRGIQSYFWQPGSANIIYLQDAGGNENYRIYQTSLATGETRDLTPFDDVRASVIAVDDSHPDLMLVALNRRTPEVHDVYRLNFASGELELDTENPGDVSDWKADHNFVVRAAAGQLPGGIQEIRIRDNPDSPWKALQQWGPDETMGGVAGYSPDNQSLWLISSVGANTSRLIEVEIATERERVIAEDPHYDVAGIEANPRTHQLEAVAFVRAKTEWTIFDQDVAADWDFLRAAHHGELSINNRSYNDEVWVVAYSADDAPARYFLYLRSAKKLEFLFESRPELAQYKLAKMEPISFPARDGLKIHGYLTLPLDSAGKKPPMVMLVHGGPWVRDGWGYNGLVQLLANRGYSVLQVNYRGSTGYGKDFLNAGDREWAQNMHYDLLDAKQWAVSNGHADASHVAVMGGSYGGYATLVSLAFTPGEFACGVDIVGPSNLITLLESIPAYWAPYRAMLEKRVGRMDEPDFLRSRSPLYRAGDIRDPLLIGQGANDPRVKQAESDQIVSAMRANQKAVEYIVFPDEGHGFVRPENSLRFFAATEQFLARHLGGVAEPPAPDEDWSAFLK